MEPEARGSFENATGLQVFPQVIYHPQHNFMMASLDGLTLDGSAAVEIKCPGTKSHSIACQGEVPEYYIPQLQHQLACLGLEKMWYFSFNGTSGVALEIERDNEYIETLIEEEKKFWKCVQTFTPPPFISRDYVNKRGPLWENAGKRLAEIENSINELKQEKQWIKEDLIEDAKGRSCVGENVSLTRTFPKGRVDYNLIPELKDVDLNKYRSEAKEVWTLRIKC